MKKWRISVYNYRRYLKLRQSARVTRIAMVELMTHSKLRVTCRLKLGIINLCISSFVLWPPSLLGLELYWVLLMVKHFPIFLNYQQVELFSEHQVQSHCPSNTCCYVLRKKRCGWKLAWECHFMEYHVCKMNIFITPRLPESGVSFAFFSSCNMSQPQCSTLKLALQGELRRFKTNLFLKNWTPTGQKSCVDCTSEEPYRREIEGSLSGALDSCFPEASLGHQCPPHLLAYASVPTSPSDSRSPF